MQFLYQSMIGPTPEQRSLSHQLCKLFEPLDFSGPNHLVETLREYIAKQQLQLQVNIHNGIVNVQADNGILVRIRSIN